MSAKPLPASVTDPLVQLLQWLAWLVLALCVARAVWLGGLLAVRIYREESVEGLFGTVAAAALLASAGGLAAAIVATR
ncbi:hypothetical protein [Nocardia sp. XZ_19_385]|uniref:hypothetical protein n=1 Tax=Nocardia sp. XZ_19_385 TaxID=2769488 RepID=UPI00188F59EA|nr:hypothetical protein [Nocardia sp. XZ_19_385]